MILMTEINNEDHQKLEYLRPYKYKSSQIQRTPIHLLEEQKEMERVEMVLVV